MNHSHNVSVTRSTITSSRTPSCLVAAAALALLAASLPAAAAGDAKPTHAQVEKAREVCAVHKRKVEAMEAKGASDEALSKERQAWEDSCVHASDLMTAVGMQ
ncbi:MAG: hypothetical protein ACRETM_01680 [Stenotrophobium sp.]